MLVFERDLEQGHKICAALDDFQASLIVCKKGWPEDAEGFDLIIAVMATGIVVRQLCGRIKDKWTDKPVVAVDSSLRCAVPVIGGHHGANELALKLADRLNLFPAITTATDSAGRPNLEALAEDLGTKIINKSSSKDLNLAFLRCDVPVIRVKGPKVVLVDDDVAVLKSRGGIVVGLGTRRGVEAREVLEAISAALKEAGRPGDDIRVMATAWLKRDEQGISEAAHALGKEVIYLSEEVLNAQSPITPSRASDLGLLGVAEPAVLALSERLIMPKKVYGRVTVALGE
ncbi:MAG TPA: cobalt-precorrin 5A hydrolase [Methanotrichaceae archaeon]|nr:cobalt-precorrin 5A hydrolase [Methanotrichaceae archaeon]